MNNIERGFLKYLDSNVYVKNAYNPPEINKEIMYRGVLITISGPNKQHEYIGVYKDQHGELRDHSVSATTLEHKIKRQIDDLMYRDKMPYVKK